MIEGGYILQPRIIDQHGIINRPPIERELWLYILRNVNHSDNGVHKRGSGLFQLTDISEDLKWYVGNRPMRYKIPALSKALRRLCESGATATARATRGIVITVCNYDYYQDPNNYEGNSERTAKATRRQREGNLVNKNDKNDKNTDINMSVSWKNNYDYYITLVRDAFKKIRHDDEVIRKQQEFNPGVDIIKTLEKACLNFWATEEGWKHKKKSRSKEINMYQTLIQALSQPQNKVYYARKEISDTINPRSGLRFDLEKGAREAAERLTGQKFEEYFTSHSNSRFTEDIDVIE